MYNFLVEVRVMKLEERIRRLEQLLEIEAPLESGKVFQPFAAAASPCKIRCPDGRIEVFETPEEAEAFLSYSDKPAGFAYPGSRFYHPAPAERRFNGYEPADDLTREILAAARVRRQKDEEELAEPFKKSRRREDDEAHRRQLEDIDAFLKATEEEEEG